MLRTYEIHFTVKGVTTVSFDDCGFDTLNYDTVAEDIFYELPNEMIEKDIDLDTIEITKIESADCD